MKKLFVVLSIIFLMNGAALEANAEIMFEGTMKITAVNNACTQNSPPVGMVGNATFHSNAITGNENYSTLNCFLNFHAHSWRLNNDGFTSTFKPALHGGLVFHAWEEVTPNSSVRVTTQTPAAFTTTTPSVTLVGQIKNPWTIPGQENCVVTFRMVGIRSEY